MFVVGSFPTNCGSGRPVEAFDFKLPLNPASTNADKTAELKGSVNIYRALSSINFYQIKCILRSIIQYILYIMDNI